MVNGQYVVLPMPTRVYAVPSTLNPFLRYALRFYSVCFSLSRVTCHALSHVTLQVTNSFFSSSSSSVKKYMGSELS